MAEGMVKTLEMIITNNSGVKSEIRSQAPT